MSTGFSRKNNGLALRTGFGLLHRDLGRIRRYGLDSLGKSRGGDCESDRPCPDENLGWF